MKGDHRACWIEAQFSAASGAGDYTRVAANCRAGDKSSCRALSIPTDGMPSYPDLPGAFGRSPACRSPQTAECVTALQRECKDGFRISCVSLLVADDKYDDEIRPLYERFAAEDCHNDIADGCILSLPALASRSCTLRNECFHLSLELEDHDPIGARNALERDCQYGQTKVACGLLAHHYLHKDWPEPVAGRGAALWKWACASEDQKAFCTNLAIDLPEQGD